MRLFPVPVIPPPPPAPTDPAVTLPPRNLFQRRVIDPILAQLTQGLTPEKIALTLAAGSAAALFPLFGVTSILCFLVALKLRLNQAIIQALNYALVIPHLGSIWLCVRIGESIFQVDPADRLILRPAEIYQRYFGDFWTHPFHSVWDYVKDNADSVAYSIVAWVILVPFYVPVVYYVALPALQKIVKVKAAAAARALEKSPEHPIP